MSLQTDSSKISDRAISKHRDRTLRRLINQVHDEVLAPRGITLSADQYRDALAHLQACYDFHRGHPTLLRESLTAYLLTPSRHTRPAHRPRRDPMAARVVRPLRCHPDTWAALDADRREGETAGVTLDRWARERAGAPRAAR